MAKTSDELFDELIHLRADLVIGFMCGIWPFRRFRMFKGREANWHDMYTGKKAPALATIRLQESWDRHIAEMKANTRIYDGRTKNRDLTHDRR